MKKNHVFAVVALLSLSVMTQCTQQNFSAPKTELITTGSHRDVVEGWIVDMEAKARAMESIYSTRGADATASRIRSLNKEIKKKQSLMEAPVTRAQYEEVMSLPEFSARIEGVRNRVSKARGRLVHKKYYESEALKSAL